MKAPSLTLGIEEEYQIIDPVTRELRSYITEILEEDHVRLGEVKPELHQSMVEIGSKVCQTPAELRSELVRLRGLVMGLAGRKGLRVFGTHVHVGIEDREFLIDALNVARYFCPHVLALSTSSPFWLGRKTGLK